MTFKTAQLSWRSDQAITKIRIAFEEFGARHGESLLPSDEDRVPGLCPQPPPGRGVGWVGQGLWGAYSSRGPMSWAKLFRGRLRRLFTVPRLQPVMSAVSASLLPSSSRSTMTASRLVGGCSTHVSTAAVISCL